VTISTSEGNEHKRSDLPPYHRDQLWRRESSTDGSDIAVSRKGTSALGWLTTKPAQAWVVR